MTRKENKKWGGYSCIVLPILLAASLIFGACSFSDSGGSSGPTPESEYNVLSHNSFMGGSLLYSPNGTGQLSSGRTFGVRFGALQKSTKQAEGGGSFDIYEDVDDAERYGTIHIISIDKNSIYFTSSIYSKDGKSKSTGTFNLKTGDSADINNDGKMDVTYKVPGIKRPFYGDARYLTFIVNEKGLYTTMFSHYDKEVANETISGFFGINVDGNFLMLTDKEPDSVPGGFADGDFIIYYCDPTDTDLPDPNGNTIKKYSYAQAGVKVYGVVAEVNNTDGSYKGVGLKTAADFNITTTANDNWEEFETFYYISEQFPDEDGPKELLKAFPESLWPSNIDSLTKDQCVTELNKILVNKTSVEKIFAAIKSDYDIDIIKDFTTEEKKYYDAYTTAEYNPSNRSDAVADYLVVIRPYIDSFYDDSPDGQTDIPDFANAYAYLALDMGKISSADQSQNALYDSARITKSASYDDYLNKNKALTNKFAIYRSTDVDLGKASDFGAKLQVGVRGDMTITKKRTHGYLGVAALATYELDGSSIPVVQNKTLISTSKSVGKTFLAGYVPMNIRMDGNFTVTMDVEAVINNFYAGFTGLYEGQINFGVNYSIIPPKVSFDFGRYGNADAEWYAGKKEKDVDITLNQAKLTLHPAFNFSLGGGIGPEYVFANLTLPVNLVGNIPYTWDRDKKELVKEDKTVNTTIKVGAEIAAVLPIKDIKISKDFEILTVFDKQLNLNTMKWKDAPY